MRTAWLVGVVATLMLALAEPSWPDWRSWISWEPGSPASWPINLLFGEPRRRSGLWQEEEVHGTGATETPEEQWEATQLASKLSQTEGSGGAREPLNLDWFVREELQNSLIGSWMRQLEEALHLPQLRRQWQVQRELRKERKQRRKQQRAQQRRVKLKAWEEDQPRDVAEDLKERQVQEEDKPRDFDEALKDPWARVAEDLQGPVYGALLLCALLLQVLGILLAVTVPCFLLVFAWLSLLQVMPIPPQLASALHPIDVALRVVERPATVVLLLAARLLGLSDAEVLGEGFVNLEVCRRTKRILLASLVVNVAMSALAALSLALLVATLRLLGFPG